MKKNLSIKIALLLLAILIVPGIIFWWIPEPADPNRGAINDNVYTSDFTELTFTVTEDWKVSAGKKLSNYLWSSDMWFDMYANDYPATWVCVAYADLAKAGKTYCSEETYFNLLKKNMSEDEKFSDYTEVKVCSNSFKAMSIKNTDTGFDHYFYLRRKDDYMIFIFVQVPGAKYEVYGGDVDIDSVMANFS